MSRCDAFGSIRNNVGQEQTIGGRRGCPNEVSAWLNTDNRQGSNCSIKVHAEVTGERERGGRPRKTCTACGHKFAGPEWEVRECPQCHAERQGIDTRRTVFSVELPEAKWKKDACEVRLAAHGESLRGLLQIGALLCTMKGVDEIVTGKNPKHGKACLDFSKETAKFLADSMQDVPENVTLLGGVSLRYALACVELVEAMEESKVKQQEQQEPVTKE